MLNTTIELFLSEYFLTKTVLGKYLEDGKGLFFALSKIFLIPEEQINKLYRLSENEIARQITTEKEYMQHQRIQKYSLLVGSAKKVNASFEEVARIKGNAILTAQSHNLVPDADASRNVVYTYLSNAATSGTVIAMRIMGILQCEGIFLNKNAGVGIKSLKRAADWNDSVSTLALLYYGGENVAYNMARLRLEVENTPFEELYAIAEEKYGGSDLNVEEVTLLNRSFNSGVLKPETYDPKYARILHSPALSIKDKEKAVFSQNKELLSLIGDLPLKLSNKNNSAVDCGELNKTALKRKAEISAIARALNNGDLRGLTSYRPILLCCEQRYVLDMYARAIGAEAPNVHCEIIDVASLSEYDLEPTYNNVFVRSIDEDADNRFLLTFYGEISERKREAVKAILQSARRSKFYLNNPGVTLDLSAVLPVCFSDEENAKWLKSCCDEIRLLKVAPEEMSSAVKDVLKTKQKLYGVGKIEIIGELAEAFENCDIDSAERLIDKAVRARREKGAAITLSVEMLQELASDDDKPKIGFWRC